MKRMVPKLVTTALITSPILTIASCSKKSNESHDVIDPSNNTINGDKFHHSLAMKNALLANIEGFDNAPTTPITGNDIYRLADKFLFSDLDYRNFIKELADNQEDFTTLFGILERQHNLVKGRDIIGMLKSGGNIFDKTIRIMFLLNGDKISSQGHLQAGHWDTSVTLKEIYGSDLNDQNIAYETNKNKESIGGYISFIMDAKTTKFIRISTGILSKTKDQWLESNDIWILKLGKNHPKINVDNLKKDILNRKFYENVSWSTNEAHAIINSTINGRSVPDSEYEKYLSTQYNGLWVKVY